MLVDVSVPLRGGMVHYPRNTPFEREVHSSTDAGDRSTSSSLRLGAHTGTHVDAPVHFLPDASGTDALSLDACIGPCFVADLSGVTGAISAADLERAGIPPDATRLLARTRNSPWADDTEFREDFCAYDASAAEWLVERRFRLVGIDYLSIEPFGSGAKGNPTHKALLGAGVVIVEGVDLDRVQPGQWEVFCLPLPVVGGDGAPARVVLRR